jgi:hypothetical protein
MDRDMPVKIDLPFEEAMRRLAQPIAAESDETTFRLERVKGAAYPSTIVDEGWVAYPGPAREGGVPIYRLVEVSTDDEGSEDDSR